MIIEITKEKITSFIKGWKENGLVTLDDVLAYYQSTNDDDIVIAYDVIEEEENENN